MKKIIRQQNYLKDLIESQENQPISKMALKSVLRGALEPLLDNPEEGVVLYRLLGDYEISGLIKRIEFSCVKGYNLSDESDYLCEKVWANTEFLCVLTHRFGIILLWDNKVDIPNHVRFYSIVNSKLQNEALDVIARNTKLPIKDFQERFKPDRRDNELLNASFRNLIFNFDEASRDAVLGFAQVQSEKEEMEIDTNSREIAHEIRNNLAICDLYSKIVKKYCAKNGILEDTINNAIKNISRAVKLAENSLVALKSAEKNVIKPYELKELINTSYDLTKIYLEDKNIEYNIENNLDIKIPVDENKIYSVIINLVKNAAEAFEKNELGGKYIKIETEEDEDFALIKVSNNAEKIKNPSKIFNEGYTTKEKGSGIGLSVCKKFIESMYGRLSLAHTGDDYTEFVIKLAKIS